MLPNKQATPLPKNPCLVSSSSLPVLPDPPALPAQTRNHVQMHRVAEAGLVRLAPVVPAVAAAGLEAVARPDLGPDGAPVKEPLGGGVLRREGPPASQSHIILPEHVDPGGLEVHHSLREIH